MWIACSQASTSFSLLMIWVKAGIELIAICWYSLLFFMYCGAFKNSTGSDCIWLAIKDSLPWLINTLIFCSDKSKILKFIHGWWPAPLMPLTIGFNNSCMILGWYFSDGFRLALAFISPKKPLDSNMKVNITLWVGVLNDRIRCEVSCWPMTFPQCLPERPSSSQNPLSMNHQDVPSLHLINS